MYQMGKDSLFPSGAGKFGYMQIKEWNAREPFPISHTQVNLKWIKDLYIKKPETVKLLIGKQRGKKKLLNNIFVYDNKITSNNNDYIKLGRLCAAKEIDQWWKATWGMRENIFKLYIW